MAELETKDRKRIRKSDFAYVDRDGEGHLPIQDESHVRNAIARIQGRPGAGPEEGPQRGKEAQDRD